MPLAELRAQCANDNTLLLSYTPICNNTSENITNCIMGGQYVAVNVTSGNVYTFSTCGSSAFDSQITIYNSGGGGALGYNDDGCGTQSSITWTATFTGVLWVLVDQYNCSNNSTCIPLNVTCGSAPPAAAGDEPCTATPLTVGTSCNAISSTTAGSTGSTGVPAPGCASYNGYDVWFSLVVPASGSVTIQTQANVITDAGMAMYTATNCSTLTLIQCLDDVNGNTMPSAVLNQTPGSTIYVRVWEYGGNNNGSFGICAFDNSPPPSSACLAPVPDACSSACDLGTLPTPPPCGSGSSISSGSPLTFNLSNEGATAEVPYSAVSGCVAPGSDVWYRFRATGTQLVFSISSVPGNPLNNPNVSLYNGNNCNALLPLRCFTGTGGALSATFQPVTPNDFYYLQISGGNITDMGDFTLVIRNNYDCDNCLLAQDLQVTPAPLNGTYGAGQTVQFCFTVSNYNQTAANWIHGIDLDFGAGWDLPTLTPSSIPTPCATTAGAFWGFYNSVTGSASGNTYGPGFFYETSSGASSGTIDGNPGNNFGDVGVSVTCPRTFCWRITTKPSGSCTPGASLSVAINTLGDSESGSWSSGGCGNDPIVNFTASLACCAPPTLVTTPAACGVNNGKITATGLGSPPWDYVWSDSTGNVIATHNNVNGPDSITGLAAGNYTLTVSDNLGCSVGAAATVNGTTGAAVTAGNGGPYCNGQTIALTSTAGASGYSWSGPGGFTSTSQNPTRTSATTAMAGTYNVTVTFSGGCSATATTTVVVNNPPIAAITPVSASVCPGGSITLTASGGSTYVWNNAATTAATTVSPVSNTTYTVTVTSASNCTATATRLVTVSAAPTATITPATVTICNGASATLTASGGTTYTWSNTQTTAAITVSPATNTTYTVTVTNASSCTATASRLVTVVPTMSPSTTVTDVLCNGGNTGSVSLTVTSGQSPYTYHWNTNATTQNLSSVVAGTYTVTITDAAQCTATASATIAEPTVLSVSEQHVNVLCNGAATGSITLTPAGGTSPYTYTWNGTSGPNPLTNLTAGTYAVTTTDAHQCSVGLSIVISEPALLTLAETHTDVTCNGTSTGNIDVTTSGGTAQYSYIWNDGANTEDRTGVAAGNYSLTVYDNYQCSATISVTISQPQVLGLTEVHTPANCNGVATGTISITTTGGTTPYNYMWSDGVQAEDRLWLAAGNYSLVAYDAQQCTATITVVITEPTALSITETHTNVSCGGGADGAIDISVTGATSPYTYLWNDGVSTQDRSALGLGTYTITVTDNNQCTSSLAVVVGSASTLNVTLQTTDVLCNGGTDGSITSTTTGGTPTYTYLWNDGVNTPDRLGVPVGIYTLSVTDQNQCMVTASATINQPVVLTVTATSVDVACNGGNTGSIDVTAAGGTSPYSYVWSDMIYTEDRVAIAAGTYSLVVYDSHQCSATSTTTINEPAVLAIAETHTDVLCNGGTTGTIDITVTGGVTPYNFTWNDGGQTEDRTAIAAGYYSVIATDNNQCNVSVSVTITEPAAIVATETHTDASCYGAADGRITITASQGIAPLTYLWNDSDTASNRNALAANTYTVTVSDANNCSVSLSATIGQPAAIVLTTSHTDASCLGYADGSATVNATGGTSPYSYTWSNSTLLPASTNTGLTAGSYDVSVYDNNQCSSTATIVVGQPAGMVMNNSYTNPSCETKTADGTITLNISGGSQPYNFNWSNGAGNAALQNLLPGDYKVTITDANNCDLVDSFTLAYLYDFTVDATPSVDIDFGETATLGFTVTGVSGNYTILWSPGQSLSCTDCTEPIASPISTTDYHIQITNEAGCIATDMLTVAVIPDYTIFAPNVFTPNNDGNNDVFRIFGNIKALQYLQIQIFNRWGEKLFESSDHQFEWDGTYKGELQPPGIYTWQLKLTFLNGHREELRKGTVTLLR